MTKIRNHFTKAFALFMVFVMAVAFNPVAVKFASAKTDIKVEVSNKDDFKNMKVGQKIRIKTKVSPGKATYSTSNKKIADVQKKGEKGYVIGVAPGNAKITVTSLKDSKVKVSFRASVSKCKVNKFNFKSKEYYYEFSPVEPDEPGTVEEPDPSEEPEEPSEPGDDDEFIEWNDEDDHETSTYYIVTGPDQLPVKQYGEYFTFTSSDPTVASIDNKGIIKILKHGVTDITATLKSDKSKSSTMKLTIAEPADEPDESDDAA